MEEYNEIMRQRLRKAEEMRALGLDPYANDFRASHTAAQILEDHHKDTDEQLEQKQTLYTVAGRVVALRSFGKAAFIKLKDRSGQIQVYVRRDALGSESYQRFKKICDVGDIVGARGRVFRTRTGELTIEAQEIQLLTKSIRPLPEKWHGLQDKETRFRQRYVDLLVNDEVQQTFRTRAQIIRTIRQFFDARDFLEVETPMMQPIAGGAAARPFVTHHNALGIELYLRIAPELYLKRLLVGGMERVYEINRNFRNEGLSAQHNPEFTMLEFYQAYATFKDLMDLTEELLAQIATSVMEARTEELRAAWAVAREAEQETLANQLADLQKRGESLQFPYGELEISFKPPYRRMTVREAVLQLCPGATPETIASAAQLANYSKQVGLEVDTEDYGELLMAVFEHVAEEKLVQPTFVSEFPLSISPLARKNAVQPDFVDRFELYVAGREIANAFSELNDPEDQKQRFLEQVRKRDAGDAEAHRMDHDYVRALEYGMPPAAGEGIGIDRLTMVFTDHSNIREVILFPLLRPES